MKNLAEHNATTAAAAGAAAAVAVSPTKQIQHSLVRKVCLCVAALQMKETEKLS